MAENALFDPVRALVIEPHDNVATLLDAGRKGQFIAAPNGSKIALTQDIPMGHKVALVPFHPGDAVVKYGVPVGEATADIAPGAHVHIHNIRSKRGKSGPREE